MLGLIAIRVTLRRPAGAAGSDALARRLSARRRVGWLRALALGRDSGPASFGQGEMRVLPGAVPLGPRGQSGRDAFGELFAHYSAPLVDYLYGMTRDREWAADLAQETFARALAATTDLSTIAHPQAWLYRIATNLALTALGRRRRFGWLPLSRIEPESGADSSARHTIPALPDLSDADLAATIAERDAVWGVLAELPPRWRAVLLLQTTAGFEVAEIAAQLRLSEANTRKILFRAKERFRALHVQAERDMDGGGSGGKGGDA